MVNLNMSKKIIAVVYTVLMVQYRNQRPFFIWSKKIFDVIINEPIIYYKLSDIGLLATRSEILILNLKAQYATYIYEFAN